MMSKMKTFLVKQLIRPFATPPLTPPNPPLIRGGKLPKNRHFPPLIKGGLGGFKNFRNRSIFYILTIHLLAIPTKPTCVGLNI